MLPGDEPLVVAGEWPFLVGDWYFDFFEYWPFGAAFPFVFLRFNRNLFIVVAIDDLPVNEYFDSMLSVQSLAVQWNNAFSRCENYLLI